MKEQYAGDVSDYRKYALLRRLAGEGEVSIGVCWMLTPPDGRPDGNKTRYLSEPGEWRHFDPDLYDVMRRIVEHPDGRQFYHIEESGILPGATFFNDILPDSLEGREAYFDAAQTALGDCPVIFFDPDNGLNVKSVLKGGKNSSKYLYRDEVADFYAKGHSVLIYQHFPRVKREVFVRQTADELASLTCAQEIVAFQTSDVVFFLVGQPGFGNTIDRQLDWDPSFMSATKFASDREQQS